MKDVSLIGHGNMSMAEFISLLKQNEIDTLIDVRSVPYSKYVPHFNREQLKSALAENNINYVFMGSILGGRHPDGFEKYMNSDEFTKGINILAEGITESNSAIMCSEVDYTKCHRRFIASRLADEGFNVKEITKKHTQSMILQKTLAGF